MTDQTPIPTGQDEARRALADIIDGRTSELRRSIGEHHRYVASLLGLDIYKQADLILAALRAPSQDRGAEEMRERVEAVLIEWSRPSAIRLAVGEMTTAQEGRTANAVAAMLAAKVRSALAQQAEDGEP